MNTALPVRVEIRRQLSRPSVRALLALMVLMPVVLGLLLRGGEHRATIDGNIVAAVGTGSAGNFTMLSLYGGAQLFLVIAAAYLFGEAVARESAWSCLRMLLTAPVPRTTLLLKKTGALSTLLFVAVGSYTVTSYLVGLALFGSGPLIPISGTGTSGAASLVRLGLMTAYVMGYLLWVAALALLLSVLAGDNPAIATLGAVGITLLSHAIGGLTSARVVLDVLPTRNFSAWLDASRACGKTR